MRYMSSLRHLYISVWCPKLRSMPEGLGQLNCLQILTTYIVGTDPGNSIRELNNLNNLHGQLHLYHLRKIKHVVDAREANLMAKQNLDDLALCWGVPESNAPEVMHCDPFELLDALKPCNKLKVLQIKEYRGNKLPSRMIEYQMLENLIELYIIACRECMKIPPVEKLPHLQILKLKHLDNLRHLCDSASTSAKDDEHAHVAFPSLKEMVLSEMPDLCSWCDGEVGNKSSLIFPELKTLEVTNCPKLTAIPILPSLRNMSVEGNTNLSCFARGLTTLHDLSLEGDGGNEYLSFQPWESLNKLSLQKYNSIIPLGAKEGDVSITPTKCRNLCFVEVSNIPSSASLWFWKCFTFLESLYIWKCDNLIYWPEEEFRSLNYLRSISVSRCPNFLGSQLESQVGRSITEVLLPTLQHLHFISCPNMVEIPKCSTSIRYLWIQQCPKLPCLPKWWGDLASLEVLYISDCPNLAYLSEGMEGLKALKEIFITKCPKIRVLPEGLLQHLNDLNTLFIEGCPHLEKHFRKYGKYRHLISEIQVTKFGEERRFGILKDLTLSFPSCKITCFSARS